MTEIRTKPLGTLGTPEPVSEANPLAVALSPATGVVPVVSTAQGALTLQPAKVYWVTASNIHATATTSIELNDSTDDSGIDRWAITLDAVDGATGAIYAKFDPPIVFSNGIYIDITGGAVVATVGFRNE